MSESQEPRGSEAEAVEASDVSAEAATSPAENPADVFEHLARIRSGISDGVITPW